MQIFTSSTLYISVLSLLKEEKVDFEAPVGQFGAPKYRNIKIPGAIHKKQKTTKGDAGSSYKTDVLLATLHQKFGFLQRGK